MRVADLHDGERAKVAVRAARMRREHRNRRATDDEVDLFTTCGVRLQHADAGERVGKPGHPGMETHRDGDAPGQGQERARDHERRRPADDDAKREAAHAGTRQHDEVRVRGCVEPGEHVEPGAGERRHRPGEQRIDADQDRREDRVGPTTTYRRRRHRERVAGEREERKPIHERAEYARSRRASLSARAVTARP